MKSEIIDRILSENSEPLHKIIKTIKNLFSKADIPPKFFKVYSESKDVYQLKWDKSV